MEYWIDEDGRAIYCDGDAGVDVPNHEMVVKSRCLAMCIADLEAANDRATNQLLASVEQYLEDDCIDSCAIREAILNESDSMAKDGLDDEELFDDPFEWMRKRCGISSTWVWQCAFGDHIDERSHAKKHWGWIRVAGKQIEMPDNKRATVVRLMEGLYEAFGEEVEEHVFDVEVGTNYIPGVPFAGLEKMKIRRATAIT